MSGGVGGVRGGPWDQNFQLFVGPHLGSFTQMSEFTHMSDFNQISKNALLCSAILAQKRQVIVKALNGLA